jgi:riboflavin biosynthesis pyrimidine reductase
MRNFEILFDDGEPSAIDDPAFAPYGKLGFPAPPSDRPWIYSNLVQSLDGIVSLLGENASGADLAQSAEDRWLMDLLRAHADGVLLGINTLVEETVMRGARGPVFRIMDPALRELRRKLGRGREKNIFVTGSATLKLGDYRAFDGEFVDPIIITTTKGGARLAGITTHPHVRYIVAGQDDFVDLPEAMRMLHRDFGVNYLVCEGGPTLYGYMERAGLIDEKFVTVSPVEAGQIVPPEQQRSELERSEAPEQLPSALRPTTFRPAEALLPAAARSVAAVRPTTFYAPGFTKDQLAWFDWISCRRVGSHQFSRYRTRR